MPAVIEHSVPLELDVPAILAEMNLIPWGALPEHNRTSKVFETSQTLHLRIHDPAKYIEIPGQTFIENCGHVLDCIDTRDMCHYQKISRLCYQIFERLNGKIQGRIMLTRLLGGGSIAPHVDPGPYFHKYKRFHIPFVSNEAVKFYGPGQEGPYTMRAWSLYQLINTEEHSVVNEGTDARVHLITDIEV